MNTEKEFYRMMAAQTEIALATCMESVPNVRIVNFVFDEEKKLIYFSTFGNNDKVKEIESNNEIAFIGQGASFGLGTLRCLTVSFSISQ